MKRFVPRIFILPAAFALVGSGPLLSNARAEISDADFTKAIDSYLSKDENVDKIAKAFERYAGKKQQEMAKKEAEEQKKEMEEQLKNPIKVDLGQAPVKGNPAAKITIFEFSDYQCPYCKRGMDTMEQLLKMYPNDVKLAFKNLPLPMHPEARPAAKAAYAAGQQGKYWEMYALLFGNQGALGTDTYEQHAKSLGLNIEKFRADMASDAAEAYIKADEKQAAALEFNGTPAFVVGGVKVTGARPVPYFKEIIERLKKGS